MTLTIGRVSIDKSPTQVAYDGDTLSLAGWFFGGSLAHAKVIRHQMLGLSGNEDEPDVPVTWTSDAGVDGYYTVGSVNVTTVRAVTALEFGFQYAVTLTRVEGGFAAPVVEVAAALALRTNAVGAVSPSTAGGRVGVPYAASFRAARFSDGQIALMASNSPNFRVSATGDVILADFRPGVSPSLMSVTSATAPADYYDGSAMIEQSVAGTWYPVVGDQIGNVVGNLLRIGNGLVRATFHTDGVLTSEIFDGTVWESSTSFSLIDVGGTTWDAEGGWKIVRNDPAACTIRTSAQFSLASGVNYPASITLHIQRGQMMFEVYADNLFYQPDGVAGTGRSLQLRAAVVTAATALTGGIRQTSNNAQGHRWVLTSPSVVTNDLTNGRITIAAPAAALIGQFGIGWELNGSAATSGMEAASIAAFYFGVAGTRQRVVSK